MIAAAPGVPSSLGTFQRPDLGQAPMIAIWEVTRACDLACRHCRAEADDRRDPRELSDHEARALLVTIRAEFGPILVVLTGGDPLKRACVLQLAGFGSRIGLRMAITPAVTRMLDRTVIGAIKDVGIRRMAVSLDGADAPTHDGFRGVAGTFDLTLAALEQARAIGLETQVNTTIGLHDFEQLEAIAALVADHGVAQWSVFITVPTGRATGAAILDAAGHERIYRRLAAIALDPGTPFAIKTTAGQPYYRVLAQRAAALGRTLPPRAATGVNDGNGFVFISALGAIQPSGFLPIEAGNVRTHALADVYRNHSLFRRLRDPDAFTGKCGRCPYNRLCGGSRSRSYALTRDPTASDPTCVYNPPLVQPMASQPLGSGMATRAPSCPFTTNELADWRVRLLALRSTLSAEVRSLTTTALSEASGDDAGQAEAERAIDVEFATVDADADLIAEIDLAIQRIDTSLPVPFGICARTGLPIETERLDLVPWTLWCATAARAPQA